MDNKEDMDYTVSINGSETILELRKNTGMSQSRFAAYYGLSTRTLQEWEQGRRTPPEYLLEMMKRLLISENKADQEAQEKKE